jgi:hypothetical protein
LLVSVRPTSHPRRTRPLETRKKWRARLQTIAVIEKGAP